MNPLHFELSTPFLLGALSNQLNFDFLAGSKLKL